MTDLIILAAAAGVGLVLSVVVVVWDRHSERSAERRRSVWLASFYGRGES